jgi:hypothetical protein
MSNGVVRNLSNMSSQYWCTVCEFHTPSKGLYNEHMKTKEHRTKFVQNQRKILKESVRKSIDPTLVLPRLQRTIVKSVYSAVNSGIAALFNTKSGDNDSDYDLNNLEDEYNSDSE